MKKLITLTAIFLCSFGALFAETPENRKENPHEIRIGIADSYMEACLENSNLSVLCAFEIIDIRSLVLYVL